MPSIPLLAASPSAGLVNPTQPLGISAWEENMKFKQESKTGGAGLGDM